MGINHDSQLDLRDVADTMRGHTFNIEQMMDENEDGSFTIAVEMTPDLIDEVNEAIEDALVILPFLAEIEGGDWYSAEVPTIHTDDADSLEALRKLLDLIADALDGMDEPFLVADSYFEAYAQELAEDTGMIVPDAAWPNNHIDWTAAADELRMDYTEVTLDGIDYLMR